MTPERLEELQRQQLNKRRLDYLFREAWYSIAEQCGYYRDMWLGTSSHGTIAIRSRFSTFGV